jgi:hypothetical protein
LPRDNLMRRHPGGQHQGLHGTTVSFSFVARGNLLSEDVRTYEKSRPLDGSGDR